MDAALYETAYRLDETHWWFRARRRVIFDILDGVSPGPYQSALDVGCGGNIHNTLALAKRAQRIVGLEISKEAIGFAKKHCPDLTIIKGAWPDVTLSQKFDIITLFDVLEHIEDEVRALKKAEETLVQGGTLVLTLPAYSLLWSEHDEYPHHKRRYTKKHLKHLITNNTSLRILRITYFNTLLFPPILAFRISKYLLGIRSTATDFFPIPSWLNWLLEKVFGTERFLLRFLNLPVGVSILCIAQKPHHEQ